MTQMVKNTPAVQETWVCTLDWEDSPGGRHGNLLQYSCLKNPHGQRSLVGYSPRGHKESDSTEQSTLSVSLQPIHHPLSIATVVGTRMGIGVGKKSERHS